MKRQTEELQSLAGLDPRRLWYVPDRRLRTKAAAAEAIAVADSVAAGPGRGDEPDEQQAFVALHTCAYRAVGRTRSRQVPEAERAEWAQRWRVIREHIVEKNLGLVYSMISRFGSKKLDEDDLLSDAMLGLTRAVDRFNPWRGYRFSTYACNVIARALMRRGKRERHYRQLFPVQFDISFEKPDEAPDSHAGLYVERLNRVLERNLGELTDLETRILSQRFPSNERPRPTFQQIGKVVGLSKERVRQIQNVALDKLREALNTDPILQ